MHRRRRHMEKSFRCTVCDGRPAMPSSLKLSQHLRKAHKITVQANLKKMVISGTTYRENVLQ